MQQSIKLRINLILILFILIIPPCTIRICHQIPRDSRPPKIIISNKLLLLPLVNLQQRSQYIISVKFYHLIKIFLIHIIQISRNHPVSLSWRQIISHFAHRFLLLNINTLYARFQEMIKPQDIKEEEKRIITPNQFAGIIKVEKQGNSTSPDSYQKTLEKFYFALFRLQEAQYLEQNEVTPKYPFVFQYSFNQIMVHLGGHQVQQKQIEDLKKYDYQQQFYQKTKAVPQVKLSVQKRKGFSTLEQKDSKNIPKNYCKAIISYAQKNQTLCQEILKEEIKVAKFIEYLTSQKKKSLNIRVFKALLQQCDDPIQDEFNRTFRIISWDDLNTISLQFQKSIDFKFKKQQTQKSIEKVGQELKSTVTYFYQTSQIFIKKYAINYIYNSKIVQHNWHIRYRQQIYKGIRNPKRFSHIKKL